jgi:hypothetical protein
VPAWEVAGAFLVEDLNMVKPFRVPGREWFSLRLRRTYGAAGTDVSLVSDSRI